jgi:hypothetical protein
MSEEYSFEEITTLIGELDEDWRQGPWDRKVIQIDNIKQKSYKDYERWVVAIMTNDGVIKARIKIEGRNLILYGGSSRNAGQVTRWARRVGLLTLVISDNKFSDVITERVK